MASQPGLLSDWPWKPLGNFKYALLAPFVAHSIYSFATKEADDRNLFNFLVFPFMLWRMIHSQIWISYSRYRTAKLRIVDKSIEFEQVDRERDWDDNILMVSLIYYLVSLTDPAIAKMPLWKADGAIVTFLLHVGPIEFLYYWLHRSLHHHYLYSRYHSHHHSSIVTEPITSVVHPFAEHLAYLALFGAPMVILNLTGTASILAIFGYIAIFDFLNNLGHCNFEFIPTWLFRVFPPLKYLLYTPSFHSLHHTQFRTNLSLFMPIYDYIYGTMDKSSESLHQTSLEKKEDKPDVVHLTHLTSAESVYHLRLGFASVSSEPEKSKWYLKLMSPVTWWSMIITSFYGKTVIAERNQFGELKVQSWAIPRFNVQYFSKWQRKAINGFIENAILEAESKGTQVLSLGLLNQSKELNQNGEFYIQKFPNLKLRVVDGSALAIAIVLNNVPQGTTQVLFRGKVTKVACIVASVMCKKGIQVAADGDEYEKLQKATKYSDNLIRASGYEQKVWLVGQGLSDEEQSRADKGTLIIPFSSLPPIKVRDDCLYHHTPAMVIPASLENVDSCENWLPRRVMSASRVAGMVHALEGWTEHECGSTILDIGKVWEACLKHGFRPLTTPF